MPNWTENRLCVKNTSEEYESLRSIFTEKINVAIGPFEKINPIPKGLIVSHQMVERLNRLYGFELALRNLFFGKKNSDDDDIFSGPTVKFYCSKLVVFLTKLIDIKNIKKFDAQNWNWWCLKNWGTKWDAQDERIINSTADEFCVEFRTAWNEPIGIYLKLHNDHPNLQFTFGAWSHESNYMRCGVAIPGDKLLVDDLGPLMNNNYEFLEVKPCTEIIKFSNNFDNYFLPFGQPMTSLSPNPETISGS